MLSIFFSKKAIALYVLIFFGALAWWSYPVIKSRYFDNTGSKTETSEENEKANSNENYTGSDSKQSPNETDKQEDDTVPSLLDKTEELEQTTEEQKNPADNSFINVSSTDCLRECEPYKYYPNELEYCQQVCGIVPFSEESAPSNCDSLKELEKDYCLKDLAIQEQNSELCDQIDDHNIKETCKNRLIEDLLEKQN